MKNKIRVISLVLCMVLLCTVNAFAWSTKNDDLFKDEEVESFGGRSTSDLFYDDFANTPAGSEPQDYAVSANGCIVTVESADVGNGEIKNCLLLHDNRNGGSTEFIGPKVTRRFEKQTSVFALEYRFKTVQLNSNIAPLNVQLCLENAVALSVMASSGDGILRITDEAILGNSKLPYGEWFTVRVVMDMASGKADVKLQSECLKGNIENYHPRAEHDKKLGTITLSGIPFATGFAGDGIDNVTFSTQRWEGKQYFDYIKIETGAKRMTTNVEEFKIEAPVTENPQNVPSGRYLNIHYNGEYHFWSNAPYGINGRTVAPLKNLAKLLGIQYTADGNGITLVKNGVEIHMNMGTTDALINGSKAQLDTAPVEKNGVIYIPVRFVSEAFGYDIGWVGETATVTLTEKEVQ